MTGIFRNWAFIIALAALFYNLLPPAARAESAIGGLLVNESPVKKPPIAFRGADDQLLKLADFKGQLLVVNLWATWCVPCVKEMPALDRLQEKLGPRGLKVIAVNQDIKGYPAAKAFLEKTGLKNLEIFTDEKSAIASRWKVPGLPASFIMTPDGYEIARLFGAAEWDSAEMTEFLQQFLPAQQIPAGM